MPDCPKRSDVRGLDLDPQNRCIHYHSARDIVAIKTKCCGVFYACKDCHNALADHGLVVWPSSEWDHTAVLCGNCETELTIREYLGCDSACPSCRADFNPGCRHHLHFYFDMSDKNSGLA